MLAGGRLVLWAYRSHRVGHSHRVGGGVTQQQSQAHTKPPGAREGVSAGAEEQRRPQVVVGKAAGQLEMKKLQGLRMASSSIVEAVICRITTTKVSELLSNH